MTEVEAGAVPQLGWPEINKIVVESSFNSEASVVRSAVLAHAPSVKAPSLHDVQILLGVHIQPEIKKVEGHLLAITSHSTMIP